MRSKLDMMNELQAMLRDMFSARAKGVDHARLARAHGYIDGYMRALLETGLATKDELLAMVRDQRQLVDGPSTREVAFEEAETAAA